MPYLGCASCVLLCDAMFAHVCCLRPVHVSMSPLCSSAHSVLITDSWASAFTVAHGSLEATFDEIAVNSSRTFNYSVTPTQDGEFGIERAKIEYLPTVDGATQVHNSAADESDEACATMSSCATRWDRFVMPACVACCAHVLLSRLHGRPPCTAT